MAETVLDRFLRYVRIDTQSREGADTYPSTEKQKDLSRLLVQELAALGLTDAAMDEWGVVMATLPSNLSPEETEKVPVIGLLGHVDTSPEVSGKDVRPVVHRNHPGGDLVLPGDSSQVIREADNPGLRDHVGGDIVTSDGTTLLGADDKAGIAEILTALEYLIRHPEIRHGTLRVGFTPDEETGRGTEHFDVRKFGADFAYTVDGGAMGEIENETFNAASAVFTVRGVNVHPGYAKGKLVNAVRIATDLVRELQDDPAPETTEKREGYLHPYVIEGGVEQTTIRVLIRDFEQSGMEEKAGRLRTIRDRVAARHPAARIGLEIQESYKNMKVRLDEDPRVVEYALDAVRRAGIEPVLQIIRGGTDGAKLCFMGLLTPNIFAGGLNFHSRTEWIPVAAMEKAVETLVHLVQIWTEKGLGE
ncbi:MAG TPA: peptidase T [bacterium]|nr:peptidase T [bacterium]